MPITRRQFLKGAAGTLAALTVPDNSQGSNSESTQSLDKITSTWEPQILNFVSENSHYIAKSATNYDLPDVFLAAVLYNEKAQEHPLANFRDNLLSLVHFDSSIGDGQIRISSAATADGKDYKKLSSLEYSVYRKKLMETASNIDYVAKYLRFLIDMPNRFQKISAEELLKNPKAMAIAATEYNRGPTKTHFEKATPNASGLHVISLLTEDSLLYRIFGREHLDGVKIREYLANQELLVKSLRNHNDESDIRKQRRLGYGVLALTALGTLYYLYNLNHNKNQ